MSIEEINESSADVPGEPTEINSTSAPIEPAELAPEAAAENTSKWGLNRRKFLTAAALGTAAAALLNKGSGGYLHLGPASALADDLSGLGCTANDVRIVGPGIVLNEPCTCTGTFDADVQFHIINNTGTTRYCVTVHLCPAFDANGNQIFPQKDIVVGDIPANFDGNKTVTITGYPCGSGLVCFGSAGSQPDGSFLKGEACPTGKCCTTITWNVKASDPCPDTTRQITSKCRHQQVCIQGFGITATCADGSCAARSLSNGCCSVACGASLNVKITATGSSGAACGTPLTISVKRPGETGFTNVTLNGSGCYVDSSPVQGTYTFRATDCHGCFRDTTLAVCVSTITTPTLSAPTLDCSGVATFTVSPCPPASGVTYTLQTATSSGGTCGTFSDASGATYNSNTCTFTVTLTQGQTTCVRVKASNGSAGCDVFSNTQSVAVPAALSIGAPIQSNNPCNGVITFTPGTVSGGIGLFSYAFKLDGGSFAAGATFVYHPTLVNGGLDTSCHSLVVRVTDANGCTATSPATTFSQCISTTTGCTP
jgi:hypothetical protein